MAEQINIGVVGYNKTELDRTINREFTEFGVQTTTETEAQTTPTASISEFFNNYQTLFYEIPKYGETQSHEYLIKTSSEYVGGQEINQEIVALQNEITQLRQENLELQQYFLNLQNPA